MLLFFPVPPSKRQAAGPLIENLPNVLTGDLVEVELSLAVPSPNKRLLFALHAAGARTHDLAEMGATVGAPNMEWRMAVRQLQARVWVTSTRGDLA